MRHCDRVLKSGLSAISLNDLIASIGHAVALARSTHQAGPSARIEIAGRNRLKDRPSICGLAEHFAPHSGLF